MILRPNLARQALCALAAIVALGACTKLTEYESSTNRYGAIDIRGKGTSATDARAAVTAIFFESVNASVPNSASASYQSDECQYGPIDTLTPDPRGQFRAGAELAVTAGTAMATVPYDELNARYSSPSTGSFNYKAGDAAQVTIPGNGTLYPGAGISVKLAEPLVPGPVVLPATGQPLVITWTATNDATSSIVLSVRYATTASGTRANEQILCAAKDDGRFELSSAAIATLRISPASLRTISMIRFRSNETLLDDRTLLHVATSVDTVFAIR